VNGSPIEIKINSNFMRQLLSKMRLAWRQRDGFDDPTASSIDFGSSEYLKKHKLGIYEFRPLATSKISCRIQKDFFPVFHLIPERIIYYSLVWDSQTS
jgi:hypothetical protein